MSVGPPLKGCSLSGGLFIYKKGREVDIMWSEALRIAVVGFSVVVITLVILAFSVKIMSFLCKLFERKKGK